MRSASRSDSETELSQISSHVSMAEKIVQICLKIKLNKSVLETKGVILESMTK